jgi:hypothetical protein
LRDFEESPAALIGSRVRDNRARRLIRQSIAQGPIQIEDLRQVLSDHVNQPYSICGHAEDVPLLDQNVTISSYIIDLTARTLWYCHGNPCKNDFVPVTL